MQGGVSSGSQLAFKLNRYRATPSVHALILRELAAQTDPDADLAVEDVLEFIRYWPTFHFPRLLRALGRIPQAVFLRLGMRHEDYTVFASEMENQFVPAGIVCLEEYGLPIQIAQKIANQLGNPETLDEAIETLRRMPVDRIIGLTAFEHTLFLDTIKNL